MTACQPAPWHDLFVAMAGAAAATADGASRQRRI